MADYKKLFNELGDGEHEEGRNLPVPVNQSVVPHGRGNSLAKRPSSSSDIFVNEPSPVQSNEVRELSDSPLNELSEFRNKIRKNIEAIEEAQSLFVELQRLEESENSFEYRRVTSITIIREETVVHRRRR